MVNEYSLNKIGERIKTLRKEKGLKQEELAKIMDVTRTVVGKWETGYQDLKTETIVKLARFFGVSCDFILTGINPENATTNYDLGLDEDTINEIKKIYRHAKQCRYYPTNENDALNILGSYLFDICSLSAELSKVMYEFYNNEYKIEQINNECDIEKSKITALKHEKYLEYENEKMLEYEQMNVKGDVLYIKNDVDGIDNDIFNEIPITLEGVKGNIKNHFDYMLEYEIVDIELDYRKKLAKLEIVSMALEERVNVIRWKIQAEVNSFISFLTEISKNASDMK